MREISSRRLPENRPEIAPILLKPATKLKIRRQTYFDARLHRTTKFCTALVLCGGGYTKMKESKCGRLPSLAKLVIAVAISTGVCVLDHSHHQASGEVEISQPQGSLRLGTEFQGGCA